MLDIFKICGVEHFYSFLALWPNTTWIMFSEKLLQSVCFILLPALYEMLYARRIGRGLCCVTQSCTAVVGCVWGLFFFRGGGRGLWALLTGALWDERIQGDWQLCFFFFLSFIVSSAYCLLQWGKLIMSSTPCLTPTPPPLPFYSDHHTWKS